MMQVQQLFNLNRQPTCARVLYGAAKWGEQKHCNEPATRVGTGHDWYHGRPYCAEHAPADAAKLEEG